VTDPLSLLRAGLDEDERIARASGGDEWMDDDRFNRVDVAEGYIETSHHGPHIARQCPKATLDRVEAIRTLIAYRDEAMAKLDQSQAKLDAIPGAAPLPPDLVQQARIDLAEFGAYEKALSILASIYAPESAEN
jgi:hypothetical protein